MGNCLDKNDVSLGPGKPGGGFWERDVCFAAGGYKFGTGASMEVNPRFTHCEAISTCNGTNVPTTAIGGKVCGKGNIEFVCAGGVNGGEWKDSGIACDPGASGSCPTSCGPMTTCGGSKIDKSKIGAKECGDKNLTYVCGPDGKWVVGGSDGKETCQCMTICPDLRVCDGTMLGKAPVGKEVCSIDRKMRICQSNMNAPPEWTYGKKCACPGDPPEPEPVVVPKSIAAAPAPPAVADNSMIIAGVFVMLFIMIMVVVLVFVMRGKKGRGEFEGAAMPMREELFV